MHALDSDLNAAQLLRAPAAGNIAVSWVDLSFEEMDVSEPTPRVNFELMQRHMHKKVLLVGQIEGIQNDVARVRAADGGTVQVMTKPGGVFEGQFVQFEGIVESPTQLHELDHTSFGDSLGNQALETLKMRPLSNVL